MSAELEVYVLEGCPHCEAVLRELESCAELAARGVRVKLFPVLRGPIVRGFQGETPMAGLGVGEAYPQLVLRVRKGSRALELVLVGGAGEGGLCERLAEAVDMVKSSL